MTPSLVRPPLAYLEALSDDVGVMQHARWDVPDRATGYCTDDVARALALAVAAAAFPDERERAERLGRRYLAFLVAAQLPDGRFHNFMSYARVWLDEVGTDDSFGRALWGLGFTARAAASPGWRAVALETLERALPHALRSPFPRARAYVALGLAHAQQAPTALNLGLERPLRAIADDLVARHATCAGARWDWFEDDMTYDNARLPEALLRIGTVLENRAYVELGARTLGFLAELTVEGDTFVPIGNAGWCRRDGMRARFDQQPLEAAALVDAGLALHAATGDGAGLRLAQIGHAWFAGRNLLGMPLGTADGGCRDGLGPGGCNGNMGAESTLAFLASTYALAPVETLRLAL